LLFSLLSGGASFGSALPGGCLSGQTLSTDFTSKFLRRQRRKGVAHGARGMYDKIEKVFPGTCGHNY
jgi:hypothetical protein